MHEYQYCECDSLAGGPAFGFYRKHIYRKDLWTYSGPGRNRPGALDCLCFTVCGNAWILPGALCGGGRRKFFSNICPVTSREKFSLRIVTIYWRVGFFI